MTADKLFDRVLALMFSDPSEKTDLNTQFLATVNIHLMELTEKENGIRRVKGEELLTEPQIVNNLSDEIALSDRILAFLPFGIAGTMLAEDDPNIATQYKNKYEEERARCVTARLVTASEDGYAI